MSKKQTKILKQHVGYWLNRLRNLVHQSFNDRLEKHDLSVAAWCILISIYDGSASSVNELAEYIEVDKATVSRILDKLVQKGLLKHEVGKNRRSGLIVMTTHGNRLVPRLMHEAELNDKHFFGSLSANELKILKKILSSVLSNTSTTKLEGWLNNNLY